MTRDGTRFKEDGSTGVGSFCIVTTDLWRWAGNDHIEHLSSPIKKVGFCHLIFFAFATHVPMFKRITLWSPLIYRPARLRLRKNQNARREKVFPELFAGSFTRSPFARLSASLPCVSEIWSCRWGPPAAGTARTPSEWCASSCGSTSERGAGGKPFLMLIIFQHEH